MVVWYTMKIHHYLHDCDIEAMYKTTIQLHLKPCTSKQIALVEPSYSLHRITHEFKPDSAQVFLW